MPGDQGEEGDSFLLLLGENCRVDAGQQGQQGQGIGDQSGAEVVARRAVISADIRIHRPRVIMVGQRGAGALQGFDMVATRLTQTAEVAGSSR
ncbi:MAG: hypothetical protein LH471_02610 [Salinibacterium sp.]|nr:hypothetical protein [Salinibacterium sp.]